ncbi:large conductance mechanosensitive channel protein MscL [Cryobacterium sinapicolor]|uniref:Large-conductance mechanosensitive channel n=1 Tax=Cryobacterium sinapicolor TaxID=1259236 RepID=A0ABY2JD99_9MICO|nr:MULTISPECIES: large conductance mechanosensitive channel protein MscL [Cryobacterium]TFC84098.1 large conductance mechanosensitive channel protein MscL [Cryobacterium sp. TMT3-29-2]TFD03108.1 large conductance mechanosensitive channel protein MscL [Cryobacterium sinapicolor]
MIQGFKEFIMRGNVIELAVAVVIGAAFTAVVNAIVTGIFNPLIAAIFNSESLGKAMIVNLPGGGALSFGLVLAAAIQFLLVAAVVYFVFVMPLNHVKHAQERRRVAGIPTATEAAAPATELDLLTEIRDLLATGSTLEQGPKHTL